MQFESCPPAILVLNLLYIYKLIFFCIYMYDMNSLVTEE